MKKNPKFFVFPLDILKKYIIIGILVYFAPNTMIPSCKPVEIEGNPLIFASAEHRNDPRMRTAFCLNEFKTTAESRFTQASSRRELKI